LKPQHDEPIESAYIKNPVPVQPTFLKNQQQSGKKKGKKGRRQQEKQAEVLDEIDDSDLSFKQRWERKIKRLQT